MMHVSGAMTTMVMYSIYPQKNKVDAAEVISISAFA